MPARFMVDTTHNGFQGSRTAISHAQLVALYGTGTPDIKATPEDIAEIPASMTLVTIDQGGPGSPIPHATVRDVESGAWTVADAVKTEGWEPEHGNERTIYCSVSKLDALITEGWTGKVWIAAPEGDFPVPYHHAGIDIAVQQYLMDQEGGLYDVSQVFDANWPAPPPAVQPPITVHVSTSYRVTTMQFGTVHDSHPVDHYVVSAAVGGETYVLARPPQITGPVITCRDLHVPGASGGTLTVAPISNGKPYRVATVKLP